MCCRGWFRRKKDGHRFCAWKWCWVFERQDAVGFHEVWMDYIHYYYVRSFLAMGPQVTQCRHDDSLTHDYQDETAEW